MSHQGQVPEERTVVTLTVGARVGTIVALLFLIAAAYLFWSPLQIYSSGDFPLFCGSAASPPTDDLGIAACGDLNLIRAWQAGALALAAVVVALGSIYAFGLNRRVEPTFASATVDDRKDTVDDES